MNDWTPDHYQQLYHLMNRRRGTELEALRQCCQDISALYTDALHSGELCEKRIACNEALCRFTTMLDTFIETDRQLAELAETLCLGVLYHRPQRCLLAE